MTDFRKCALCPSVLSGKNRTKEHIIPNAIGGRKKTTGFICDDCNKKFGENWDAELARQLNWFSLSIGISRERGEPPKQIVQSIEGDRYWLHNDGSYSPEKSTFSETEVDGAVSISMTAKNLEEAKQRLKGIARKYPKLDVQKAISKLELKTDYLRAPLCETMSVGGSDVGHSLVKTAFAFASECGVPHTQCEKGLEYLLSANVEIIPYGLAYLSELVENRPRDKVFHCVSLHADPKTGRVWSYIEYFGFHRWVVLLGEKYTGPYRSEIYAINPIDGTPVGVRVPGTISAEELSLIVNGDGCDTENYNTAANFAMSIIMERGQRRTLENAVAEGFHHAAKSLGIKEGEMILPEHAAAFTAHMMEKINPCIERLVRSTFRNERS